MEEKIGRKATGSLLPDFLLSCLFLFLTAVLLSEFRQDSYPIDAVLLYGFLGVFFGIHFWCLLLMPRERITADDRGIYLHFSHRKTEFILYSQILGVLFKEEEAEVTAYYRRIPFAFSFFPLLCAQRLRLTNVTFGLLKTGAVFVHTDDNMFCVSHLYHAEEVCNALRDRKAKWDQNFEQQLMESAEKQRAAEEQNRPARDEF